MDDEGEGKIRYHSISETLKQSLAFVILIPGWIVVLYVLGYKYFLERVQGNVEIAKFFLPQFRPYTGTWGVVLTNDDCPTYLVERGKTDEVFDIKLSLIIVFCNLFDGY